MDRTRLPIAQPHTRLRSAACVALLAIALVCAQSLGLWHRMVHVGSGPSAAAAGQLEQLFADHQGGPDCLSFDHACHGDAVGAMHAVAAPLALALLVVVVHHGLFNSRWHALFHARGPPSVR